MAENMDIIASGEYILCCDCACEIPRSSPVNKCLRCLQNDFDITENIPKQLVLHFCRNCERYLQPPLEWISAALESRELLAICLKKLKGLKGVKLIDAGFVWTEPHSKRLKVKLTVHGDIGGGNRLEKVFIVEYIVQNQMCDDCHRTEAKDFWRCLVQVRQRTDNKKTFYYLEQLILKYRAHENTLGIKQIHGGLDFYYASENHARKMVDFLQAKIPAKITTSKRLISHDIHSNSYNYKYVWSVEIAPISKDSAICLSKKLRQQLGNLSPFCLIRRVTSNIHIIDPQSAQMAELTTSVYYREPFQSVRNPQQLVEYVVMDIEEIKDHERKYYPGQGKISHKHKLCDVWVLRSSELGINDNPVHTRSHLGAWLKVGDYVLGYNLSEANINDAEVDKLSSEQIPDVVLVRKQYNNQSSRSSRRLWKLKHLAEEETDERSKHDYKEFLDDLEEDCEIRQHVNIYRDAKKMLPVDQSDIDSLADDTPKISLAEMLEEMSLDAPDDAMGEDGENQ